MKIHLKICIVFLILAVYSCTNRKTEKADVPAKEIVKNEKSVPILLALAKDKSISKPIAGGDRFRFTFNLPENYFTHIAANQKGIDFKVSLLGAMHDTISVFDTPNGQSGIEDVYFISKTSGTYTLELEPFSAYAEPAGFDILLKTARPATQEDRIWMELFEQMRVANEFRKKKETLDSAVISFNKIIPQWQQMGDTYQEAVARRSLGYTLRSLGKKDEAKRVLESVLPLWQKLGETRYEAFTYLILASMYKSDADYEYAIPLTLSAIEKWIEAGDQVQESRAYSDVASFYMMTGDFETSKKYYDKSIEKAKVSGSMSVQGIMLREYGNAWQTFGDDLKVIEYYTEALHIYKEMGHLPALALVNRMAGDFLFSKGKKQEAKAYFENALQIYKTLGNKQQTISMNGKLGTIKS